MKAADHKTQGFTYLNVDNIGCRRTNPAGFDHLIHRRCRTNENRLHSTVRAVPDPAVECAGTGLVDRPAPEPYALDAPRNPDAHGLMTFG
jgi:hypothetical protein